MKLSTRGRYGLKAMFDLALHDGNEPIPLKLIAERQKISDQYLEQIFSALKKAELVRSVRGAQGGYFLYKKPSEITVGNILRVLEGNLKITDCQMDEDLCENSNSCATKGVWTRLQKSMEAVVDSITLQDMVDDYIEGTDEHVNDITDGLTKH